MNNPLNNDRFLAYCRGLEEFAATLPAGYRRRIMNKVSEMKVTVRKARKQGSGESLDHQSDVQIADRRTKMKAILAAMVGGRTVSFLDSADFGVSEMHTQIHCIRRYIEQYNLPYELVGEWFEFAPGKRAKKYHITSRAN